MPISNFVSKQLPAEYSNASPKFVEFLEQYYNWLESQQLVPGVVDIESTIKQFNPGTASDEVFPNFVEIYLTNLPRTTAGNIRILLRYILDLYRTKGTFQSFKLFFRAIFNEDVELFIPGEEILRPSDSQWIRPQYLEVTDLPSNRIQTFEDFTNNKIIGSISGATATCSSYERKFVNNKFINVLQLSNVIGQFIAGEYFDFFNTTNFASSPRVLGSLNYIAVQTSQGGFNVGETLVIEGSSSRATGKVVSTRNENGKINLTVINGGSGYSNSTIVQVTGTTGAEFKATINYNNTLLVTNTIISPLMGVVIGQATTALTNPNIAPKPILDAQISEIFDYFELNTGSITRIENIRPNDTYVATDSIEINVYDPFIANLNMLDSSGAQLGNNAIVTAELNAGKNLVSAIDVTDSGYGFNTSEIVNFYTVQEPRRSGSGVAVVNSQGISEGYWSTRNSHLNERVLQDSYYYQQFSYEIQTGIDSSVWIDAFKLLLHPTGLKLFTKYLYSNSATNVLDYVLEGGWKKLNFVAIETEYGLLKTHVNEYITVNNIQNNNSIGIEIDESMLSDTEDRIMFYIDNDVTNPNLVSLFSTADGFILADKNNVLLGFNNG